MPESSHTPTEAGKPRPTTWGQDVIPAESLVFNVSDLRAFCDNPGSDDRLTPDDWSGLRTDQASGSFVNEYFVDAQYRLNGLHMAYNALQALQRSQGPSLPFPNEGYGTGSGRLDRLRADLNSFNSVLTAIDPQWQDGSDLEDRVKIKALPMVKSLSVRATYKSLLFLSACLDDERTRQATREALNGLQRYRDSFVDDRSPPRYDQVADPYDIVKFRKHVLLDCCSHLDSQYEATRPPGSEPTLMDLDSIAGPQSTMFNTIAEQRRRRAMRREEQ